MFPSIPYFLFLVFLGLAPSLIWLWYYLKKDDHKEPKKILFQVFILGGLSVALAFFAEYGYLRLLFSIGVECIGCEKVMPDYLGAINASTLGATSFIVLIGIAYIEEFLKYIVVKFRILKEKAFDEPVDAMIYLVVGALGFAAFENIGYILSADPSSVFSLTMARFITAILLHVLASALVGYFFALSIIHNKSRLYYITIGLILATIFHALFNLLIILMQDWNFASLYLLVLMISMWKVISYLFDRIKTKHYNMQRQINNI